MKQELKHTELRCGNLVYNPYLNEIRTVDYLDIRDHAEKILYTPFEGIELTPEWLERFGFEKKRKQIAINVCGELFNYWTGTILIWEVKEGVYTLDAVFKNPIHRHPNPSIVYTTVHSLQNLTFALTGRELELKK